MVVRMFTPRVRLVLLVLTVLAYILIRLTYLDRVVTTDEQHWLGRSANFYRALRTGELEHTYQMAHPGVMTMWAGAIAYFIEFPDYPTYMHVMMKFPGATIGPTLVRFGRDPMELLNAARIVKVLLQAGFFAASLFYMQRLFGFAVAILAGALITFDPFLSGHDTAMHVDGLFAIAAFAAILAFAYALDRGVEQRRLWAIAGVLAAMAWLTRTTGLLIPGIAGAILGGLLVYRIVQWRRGGPAQPIRDTIAAGSIWLGCAAIATLVLLPALFVDPVTIFKDIYDFSSDSAAEGHASPLFFNGRVTHGDPGFWYYPVSLVWRLTPVTIAGVVLALAFAERAFAAGWLAKKTFVSLGIVSSFGVLYLLGMSLASKKFDRYVLPIYEVLDLVAAVGFVLCVTWLLSKRTTIRERLATGLTIGVVGAQLLATVSVFPYRLDYYNPLLGGAVEAQDVLQVGWGEGTDQVVDWLRAQYVGPDPLIVTTSSAPGPMEFLIPPGDLALAYVSYEDFTTPRGWFRIDYFAHGIQQEQRNIGDYAEYLAGAAPSYIAYVEGVPFHKVYDINALPLPERIRNVDRCRADFVPGLSLHQVYQGDAQFELYFVTGSATVPSGLEVRVTATGIDANGQVISFETQGQLVPGKEGMVSQAVLPNVGLADGREAEQYTLTISVVDLATGEPMPASLPGDLRSADSVQLSSTCYEKPPGEPEDVFGT